MEMPDVQLGMLYLDNGNAFPVNLPRGEGRLQAIERLLGGNHLGVFREGPYVFFFRPHALGPLNPRMRHGRREGDYSLEVDGVHVFDERPAPIRGSVLRLFVGRIRV